MDKEIEFKVILKQLYEFESKTLRIEREVTRREHFAECAKAYLINNCLDLKKWDEACVLFDHSNLDVEKIFKEIQKNS